MGFFSNHDISYLKTVYRGNGTTPFPTKRMVYQLIFGLMSYTDERERYRFLSAGARVWCQSGAHHTGRCDGHQTGTRRVRQRLKTDTFPFHQYSSLVRKSTDIPSVL